MMTLNFMQKVDYWLGHPLCLIATLCEKLFPALLRNRSNSLNHSQKVIFIELSEMGAAIIAAPAIRKAISDYGKENVFFLIFERNRSSIDVQNLIIPDNLLIINDRNFLQFLISALRAIVRMRRLRISIAIDLELFSRCTALLAWISGAQRRFGFGSGPDEGPWRGKLFTDEFRYNPHIHMSMNFLAMMNMNQSEDGYIKEDFAGLNATNLAPQKINPTELLVSNIKLKIEKLAGSMPSDLVLLNPDAGSLPLRGWPASRWSELIEELSRSFPLKRLMIIGLPQFKESATMICALNPKIPVINFSGETKNLSELLALMSLSNLLVTCDSGPAHFASLVNLPSVVLFGPETPALYKPLGNNVRTIFKKLCCSPCFSAYNHRQSNCSNNVCMSSITVDDVMDSIKDLISTH